MAGRWTRRIYRLMAVLPPQRLYANCSSVRQAPDRLSGAAVQRQTDMLPMKMSEGGRVVVPVEIRKALGIKDGDTVLWELGDGEAARN